MKFCVLIEISKERISFLYSRSDSENGFVPFVEQGPIPLAIYCSGNDVIIGQFAVNEANKKNPNACKDVFKTMRNGGTFKYRGEEKPNNLLLFTAIQHYLSVFFDDVLIGQMGRLEQNVATMPICFLFHADVDENERLFVKDSFLRSGYANIDVKDYDKLSIQSQRKASGYTLCVTSNGTDLFVNVYASDDKLSHAMVIRQRGRDPRLPNAIDCLWNSLGYDSYYLNRAQEQAVLTRVAERFLSSDRYSFSESVTFSNGTQHNVSLSLHELEQYNISNDGKVMADVKGMLINNGISVGECSVLLLDKAANNSFFSKTFRSEFTHVASIDSTCRTNLLTALLNRIVKADYCLAPIVAKDEKGGVDVVKDTSFQHTKTRLSKAEARATTTTQQHSVPPPPPGPVQPTKRDERDFRALSLGIRTHLTNGERQKAQQEADHFLAQMHANRVFAFDERVAALLQDEKQEAKQDTKHEAQQGPIEPTERDKRDLKLLKLRVKTLQHNGACNQIKAVVDEFRQQMHAKGVYAFDGELKALAATKAAEPDKPVAKPKTTPRPTTPTARKPVQQRVAQPNTPELGVLLMRKEQFKEAREWFRANNKRSQADDCSNIIRWLRLLPVYESELSRVEASKNKSKARAREKELDDKMTLYRKYGIDSTRLLVLRNAYKRIK